MTRDLGDPWALHRLRGQPIPRAGVDPYLARDLVASALLEMYPRLAEPEVYAQDAESREQGGALLTQAAAMGGDVNLSDLARGARESDR